MEYHRGWMLLVELQFHLVLGNLSLDTDMWIHYESEDVSVKCKINPLAA